MRVEGVGDVKIVGDEVAQPVAGKICAFWLRSGDGNVGATEFC